MGKIVGISSGKEEVSEGSEDPNLMTAREVGAYLRIASKKVYELPIPRVELSARRVRWLQTDLLAYIRRQRRAA